jgi:hypothetical protein
VHEGIVTTEPAINHDIWSARSQGITYTAPLKFVEASDDYHLQDVMESHKIITYMGNVKDICPKGQMLDSG